MKPMWKCRRPPEGDSCSCKNTSDPREGGCLASPCKHFAAEFMGSVGQLQVKFVNLGHSVYQMKDHM